MGLKYFVCVVICSACQDSHGHKSQAGQLIKYKKNMYVFKQPYKGALEICKMSEYLITSSAGARIATSHGLSVLLLVCGFVKGALL